MLCRRYHDNCPVFLEASCDERGHSINQGHVIVVKLNRMGWSHISSLRNNSLTYLSYQFKYYYTLLPQKDAPRDCSGDATSTHG